MNEVRGWKKQIMSSDYGLTTRVAAEFFLLALVLVVIGVLMQGKMNALLNSLTEQSIARQTADFSLIAEERFNRELTELTQAAKFMEKNPDRLESALSTVDARREGIVCGLISKEYGRVMGAEINQHDFRLLRDAFAGRRIVDYSEGRGLIFAVPVFSPENEKNVRYVLYRLYTEKLLPEKFGLAEYGSDSRILLRERGGSVIVPYADFGESGQDFFRDATIKRDFATLRQKLQTRKAAAVYSEGPMGKYFLFGADLPQTNCSMVGYVPWEATAGGISRIYDLVLMVVSLLLALFAVASIYLFLMQSRAAESEALREAKEIADKANRAKSDFLASMSHEIRTPINTVLGMNEMILRESHEPDIRGYSRNIAGAGHALLSLINDILDFSKIESGRMELVETNYKLDTLLSETLDIITPRAAEKGLEFRTEVRSTLPNALYGDEVRIRQILINLLSNAVKYTPKGSITFSVSGESAGEDDLILKIAVADTGIGIKEEDKDRLFRGFERLDMVKNRSVEGTGLGLAITMNLLSMMDGEIHVDSVYGEGSTFRVEIPQKVANPDSVIGEFPLRKAAGEPAAESGVYRVAFRAPDARILVVDDNDTNLLVVKNLLKATEINVTTCLSGEECLQMIAEAHYDIVLLDHMMPGMDGIETLKASWALPGNKCRETPFIALTANAVSGAREMFLGEGFSDYMSKPIAPEKLEQLIRHYLPQNLVQPISTEPETAARNAAPPPAEESAPRKDGGYIDRSLGLRYNGGMEDMYDAVLSLFASSQAEKREKIQKAFDAEEWRSYTVQVHGLKSTSLTIGCQELSEAAKALELAGKKVQSPEATGAEKEESLAYIKEHHEEVMALYEKVAKEANPAG